MGIHTSCDSCYKSMENDSDFVTLSTTSNSRTLPVKHVFVVCLKCIKSTAYFYFNLKNPSYVEPPKAAEPEVVGNEAKQSD